MNFFPLDSIVFTNKYILYLLIFLVCFYFTIFRNWKHQNQKFSWTKQFPTPWLRLPLLGNVHLCWGNTTNVAAMFTSQTKQLGLIWTFWKFRKPYTIIADHEIAKQIFLSNNIDKNSDYDFALSSVFGKDSIITSPGAQWIHDRKYLQKAFHYEFFNEVLRISNEEGMVLIDKIRQGHAAAAAIDADSLFTECTARISIRSQYKDQGKLPPNYNEILSGLDIGRKLTHVYMYAGFLRYSLIGWITGVRQLERELLTTTNNLVANIARSSTWDGNGVINEESSRPDLWSLIFNPSKPFSWSKDQVISLVSAATDTTSTSTIMTLFYLANHPQCLEKAIEEVDQICTQDSVANLSMNELSKLKYVEMCWKEALRLHTPVPMVGRKLREEVKLPDGRYLPPGADVYIMLADIHRNPNLFENPDQFNPERFSDSNINQIKPGSFIPFSFGSRNCMGLKVAVIQAKLMLAQVLWNFKVSTPQKPEDIKPVYMASSYPYPAIELNFHPRRNL